METERAGKVLIILAAGCLLLSACAAGAQAPVNPTVGAAVSATEGGNVVEASVISADRNGKTVSFKVGDTFEVKIPCIPTEGFKWIPMHLDTNILSQLGEPVYEADSSAGSAGGTVSIRFKVVGAGKTNLSLVYANSPADGAPGLYKSSFGVVVEAK